MTFKQFLNGMLRLEPAPRVRVSSRVLTATAGGSRKTPQAVDLQSLSSRPLTPQQQAERIRTGRVAEMTLRQAGLR